MTSSRVFTMDEWEAHQDAIRRSRRRAAQVRAMEAAEGEVRVSARERLEADIEGDAWLWWVGASAAFVIVAFPFFAMALDLM